MKAPESLAEEHRELFRNLRRLAARGGRTGREVRKLLDLLDPHFEREEQAAMPLLGALKPLSEGVALEGPSEVMSLHERLASEYPQMLEEHRQVKGLIDGVRKTAGKGRQRLALALMDELEHHACVEEEVLYPAALLVGELAEARAKVRAL